MSDGELVSTPAGAGDVPLAAAEDRDTSVVWDLGFCVLLPVLCWYVNATIGSSFFHVDVASGVLEPGALGVNLGGPVAGVLWLLLLVSSMLVWVLARPASALLAGALAACALWAAVFALTILPLSLMGLFFGVGILGFVPFLSALRCFRAARRAFREAAGRRGRAAAVRRLLAGAALAIALALGGGFTVRSIAARDVAALGRTEESGEPASVSRLALLRPLLFIAGEDPARDIVQAWDRCGPGAEAAALQRAHMRLTGLRIDDSPYLAELRAFEND